jgi:hypothetical protein
LHTSSHRKVGRGCGSRHDRIAGRIELDAVCVVVAAAAQVGGIDQRARGPVELSEKYVVAACVGGLKRALDREVSGRGCAGHVGVALRIHSDREWRITAAAAEICREERLRINHQWLGCVVRADFEAEFATADHVPASDGNSSACGFLVNRRLLLPQRSGLRLNEQVAGGIETQAAGAIDAQPDFAALRAGRDHEIMFQIFTAEIIDQIDARVDVAKANLRVPATSRVQRSGESPSR